MGFYNLYKIFKDIFKTIFGYKNFRKLLIFLVIGAFCFYCFSSLNVVFGADTATTDDQLVTTYQRASQDSLQNMLVINSIKPFVGNTDYWNNVLKPLPTNKESGTIVEVDEVWSEEPKLVEMLKSTEYLSQKAL